MPTNVQKLKGVKSDLADVYASEAQDEIFDNGLLDTINNAVKDVEQAIAILQGRGS